VAKRKPSRKRIKQQKREATKRVRNQQGQTTTGPELKFDVDFSAVDPDLLADVRGAFEPGGVISPAAMSELAIDSHNLFQEPEFQGVLANPIMAAARFLALAEESDLEPFGDDMDEVAPLIFELAPYLLREDPDLRTDLITSLQHLRPRLKREGFHINAGRAAMAQLLLQHGEESSWRLIGLAQRAVTHSVFKGFRMFEVEEEVMKTTERGLGALRAADFVDGVPEALSNLVEDDAELRVYLERHVDKLWESGIKAILRGELEMSLFTLEEADEAAAVLSNYLTVGETEVDVDKEGLLESFSALVERLLTPERARQLGDGLSAVRAAHEDLDHERSTFLRMAEEVLADAAAEEPLTQRAMAFGLVVLMQQALIRYQEQSLEEE
jgi:hypothetical protein